MLLGAHQSVAGGLHRALERGKGDACRAVQVFTKNSGMWREPEVSAADLEAFRAAHAAIGRAPVLAHASYLINLATDKGDVLELSKSSLAAEIRRSSALGIDYVVLHPGAHLGAGDDVGVRRCAEALDEVHERVGAGPAATARVLLENTAGQGTCVGCTFEQLGGVFELARSRDRLGVCLDTQHAFAAGYDLSTPDGYARTVEEFDRKVGLARLRAFHLNDSKKPLGSRVDRHEHVGEGFLGLGLFWRLANDARFAELPGVIEIEPREGERPYAEDVALLASLVGAEEPKPKTVPFTLELSPPPPPKKRGRR